jgi:multiple sugar transport system permease protein
VNSFRSTEELFDYPPSFFPQDITLDLFRNLFENTLFLTYLKNSLIVGIIATLLTIVLATFGGYGLARSSLSTRTRRTLGRSVLFIYMFPAMLIGVPLYLVLYQLGLLNSYLALTAAHLAITLPLCLWIMWQHFQTIPMGYEEIAWVNGAGRLRTFFDIMLPMSLPAIITIAIFAFSFSWNDFTFAIIIMTDREMLTLPVGVEAFSNSQFVHYGLILSASLITMIPTFIILLFGQKYLIRGTDLS